MKDPSIIVEALTSSSADRMIQYERLEFYGDSVLTFLAILEIFLCENSNTKESELDQLKIKMVSN